MHIEPNGIVTLTTDYGTEDGYVGAMKGRILSVSAGLRILDLAHDVPPQDVARGAVAMRAACPLFPPGTVHVGVIDPGVGTERAPVVVTAGGQIFVGPDNGLLWLAACAITEDGAPDARAIRKHDFLPEAICRTFHGRDLFAPTAAALAAGLVVPEELGESIVPRGLPWPEPTLEPDEIRGEVVYADRFGNLITNIPRDALGALDAGELIVRLGDMRPLPLRPTYAAVDRGHPLALVGSEGLIEVAVRDGSARTRTGLGPGARVRVRAGED